MLQRIRSEDGKSFDTSKLTADELVILKNIVTTQRKKKYCKIMS